ncbi:MAG: CotS family spore coat protein [Clostridiales bacterium]|nr:CotS family spore coat protein [Clostridiales bacterium]
MNDRALKVLEQYELDVINTRRGRGAWFLETPGGRRILSDYSGSEDRALFQNYVMAMIREGGYQNVDRILPNREGSLVSRDWEGNRYVVKEWYPGRECDTSSENEILQAVENLARLHRLMKAGEQTEFRKKYTAQMPSEEMCSWNAQLRRIRIFVRARHRKSAFEQMFLECYEKYYAKAQEALELLTQGRDGMESLQTERDGCICHGDYSHHHVLVCGYEIATTNFDRCRFDLQVKDLCHFMRKILEKQDWNIRLGTRMLAAYSQIRPISRAEQRLIRARMLYPEKFRKLAASYYDSNKAWISRQYIEKLEKMNRQEGARLEFVKIL